MDAAAEIFRRLDIILAALTVLAVALVGAIGLGAWVTRSRIALAEQRVLDAVKAEAREQANRVIASIAADRIERQRLARERLYRAGARGDGRGSS